MGTRRFNFAPAAISAVLFVFAFAASARHSFAQEVGRYAAAAAGESRRPAIKLADVPAAVDALKKSVRSPEDIDGVTRRLGIEPRLLNFNLATPVDLSDAGLGKAVHIPVQITSREGGRKSLYFLNPGEEVLAGVFVTDDGLALRYVKRLTGRGTPASTGDTYETRLTTTRGEAIHQEQGRLEVLDPEHGIGQFVPMGDKGGGSPVGRVKVWILWSCILVDRGRGAYY
jgi:hypothetical protein